MSNFTDCPPGFSYDAITGTCVGGGIPCEVTPCNCQGNSICPPNFVIDPDTNKCTGIVPVRHHSATKRCPDNYEYNIILDVCESSHCPEGYQRVEGSYNGFNFVPPHCEKIDSAVVGPNSFWLDSTSLAFVDYQSPTDVSVLVGLIFLGIAGGYVLSKRRKR